MSYLKRLPVSELKVDRSFVSGMVADADDAVLVPKQGRRPPPPVMLAAAACSVGAAAIHAVVCSEHFRDGLLYEGFFAVATGAQCGSSPAPSPPPSRPPS